MKKSILCAVFLLFAAASGCSSSSDQSLTDLQTKVTQLEKDMADLQTKANESDTKTVDNSDAGSVTDTLANMEALTTSVSKLTAKVEEIVPAGSDANRMEQYFDLKKQLKQLDKKIDAYDDNLEIQYKQETLSYTDYRIQEREAQELHNTLNASEDTLRLKFRMDD